MIFCINQRSEGEGAVLMNKKYKVLFKDTIIFALGGLGSKLILFFLVPLYTNYLTTEEYGVADLVFTIAQLIIPIVSVVIFEAVIRFGLMKDKNPAAVLKAALVVIFIGSIVTVAISPLVGLYRSIAAWKWYLCIYIILNVASNVLKSYLKVKDKNKSYAIISVSQTLCLALLNILLLVVFHTGVEGYLLSNIIALAAATVLTIAVGGVVKDLKKVPLDRVLLQEMVLYSAPLILNDLSWWVIHSSDKMMLEAMVGAAALGIYTVATKMPSLINVLIGIFSQAWGLSSIKEMDSTNDTKFYAQVFEGYSFVTFGACVLIVSIVKPFMALYVGKNFQGAWVYVSLLLVSAVFSSIASYYGQLYVALKKSVNNMITTLTGAVVNIIVNFIFIPIVGIWGAVIGTVVAYIVLATARMIDVNKYIEIKIDHRKYFLNCTTIIAQGIIVSADFYVIPVSIVSIVLFVLINRDMFNILLGTVKRK